MKAGLYGSTRGKYRIPINGIQTRSYLTHVVLIDDDRRFFRVR